MLIPHSTSAEVFFFGFQMRLVNRRFPLLAGGSASCGVLDVDLIDSYRGEVFPEDVSGIDRPH